MNLHWKGAAEMVLAMCSNYYNVNGNIKVLGDVERKKFDRIIQGMAANSLRWIAFAHKQVPEKVNEGGKTQMNIEKKSLTLLGIVGLNYPCPPGVKKAIEECQYVGVNMKMITGDNIFLAKAITTECEILKPNQDMESEAMVEGVEFRNYTPEERTEKIDKNCVMASSSAFDKLLMLQCGGRCVYTDIQKFIQFQLTVNVAALIINFVAVISASGVPLSALQLLWLNLIMDILGAFALATRKPTKELMEKPPVGRTKPLTTNVMWRNLLCQAFYQTAVMLILQFKGKAIFNVSADVNYTLMFNVFVLCQVFNEFNARKLEKKNVFERIQTNKLFLGIVGVTIML
ncbi:hypothetical protein C3L33_20121, partial [Rhododendron williamsianum]